MKRKTLPAHFLGANAVAVALLLAISQPQPAFAASAELSEVIRKVSITEGGASHQAKVGETLDAQTFLKTGRKSRAELTFADSTLLRVGSNTSFSFAKGHGKGKDFALTHGTAFISAPKKHGGVFINCGLITAAITGSTSTVTNTSNGVGMFAATGDNFLIHDGHWIRVKEFTFTWIPWIIDDAGNKVPDLDNMVNFPYDALAQTDTAWVCRNLDEAIRNKIKAKKIQLFGDGELSNRPQTNNDHEIRNITVHTPPPPPPGNPLRVTDGPR